MLRPESWCLIEELLLEKKKKVSSQTSSKLKGAVCHLCGRYDDKKTQNDITELLAAQVTDYFLIIAQPLSVLWRIFFPTFKRVQ